MLLGNLGDGPKDLVRARDVRDIDMDDAPAPGPGRRNHPNEEGEQHAHQHAKLSLADTLSNFGGYISARRPDGRRR